MLRRILILDDDLDVLDMLNEVLTYYGYTANIISRSDAILEIIEEYKPDLLLLDFRLFGKNGGEICNMIKKNPETQDLPVIIISAYSHLESVKEVYCCDDILQKPFDLTSLMEKVEKHIKPLKKDVIE
ncbi:response regulator [Rubrolithibacter danxiaensis]|uniref:response regulator n=1 Tax=Rubrolithibacter danxiaensis TaxID=3390805 RepID=UPI003BF9081F